MPEPVAAEIAAFANCNLLSDRTANPANRTANMANTVNLNVFRKARAKAADKSKAEANRVIHGLPKAERDRVKAERERLSRLLDQTKRKD